MQKYGFVYIWFDRKHKRYYIGCHWGHVNDRYICSSRWMRQAYKKRPNDFKRRIIETDISTRELTIKREAKWLYLVKEEELGKRYYNVVNRAFGHWSVEEQERRRIGRIVSAKNKGKHFSPETQFKKGERRSPKTEFVKGQQAHNAGKTLEQTVGAKRAAEIKQTKSDRYKGKSFSPSTQFTKGQRIGKDNSRARAISTPFGMFDTLKQCSDQTGMTIASIHYKLRTEMQSEWQYV